MHDKTSLNVSPIPQEVHRRKRRLLVERKLEDNKRRQLLPLPSPLSRTKNKRAKTNPTMSQLLLTPVEKSFHLECTGAHDNVSLVRLHATGLATTARRFAQLGETLPIRLVLHVDDFGRQLGDVGERQVAEKQQRGLEDCPFLRESDQPRISQTRRSTTYRGMRNAKSRRSAARHRMLPLCSIAKRPAGVLTHSRISEMPSMTGPPASSSRLLDQTDG